MWQCSKQHENREEAKFCGKCGEMRIVRAHCSKCGALLEPEDVFCTSCGHPCNSEPEPAASASAFVAPVEATPFEESALPTEATVATATTEEPQAEEPVTFSFGGMSIAMKDDPTKPERAAKPAKAGGSPSTGARGGGMSSVQSAILSFVLIAAVLGLAFYLVTK